MNPENVARVVCRLPLDTLLVDGIETALTNPETGVLLIEFYSRLDSERMEVDQILAGGPLIGRLRGLLRKMEVGPKPIVALISESLGGLQLEIALACHARLTPSQTIKLGFPWLKYGLMPILGGTQRLPRLVGIGLAARMLLQCESVAAAELAASGLIELADHRLAEAALDWAKAHPEPKQPWDLTPQELSPSYAQTSSNRLILENIYLKLRRRVSPEEAAPTAILKCLQDGLERSIDAGLRLEAEHWSLVRHSPSTLNRLQTLHGARQKAIRTAIDQSVSIKCL